MCEWHVVGAVAVGVVGAGHADAVHQDSRRQIGSVGSCLPGWGTAKHPPPLT